jgi:hypothetical protein
MNRFMRTLQLVAASVLLLVTSPLSSGVRAEEEYRITNDVVLTNVRVSPAKTGGQAHITFVLENRSAERILFRGITVTDACRSRIVASLGNGATTTLDSIPVAPGGVVSADGEALWVEVNGLFSLASSGMIEATVSLGTTIIPISLTVNRESKPSG